MTTSAEKLESIISSLAKKFKFDEEEAIQHLATKELLPKKLMPKDGKDQSLWASKRAQEFGEEHEIVPTVGTGSGKDGRWTLADVQKQLQKPVREKVLISPNALILARENQISIVNIRGSGKEGRILLKDVEAMITSTDCDDELNITPRAFQEAYELKISDDDLEKISGSGQDGRILLKDVQDYHTSSSDEKKEKKKGKKKQKVVENSDSESDSE